VLFGNSPKMFQNLFDDRKFILADYFVISDKSCDEISLAFLSCLNINSINSILSNEFDERFI
jgi:hypothetical protein